MKTKLLALLLACSFAAIANASDRFITTTGTVRVEIPADKVKVNIGIRATDPTLDGCNAKLDAQVSAFMEKAKSLGIRDRDVVLNKRDSGKEREWENNSRIDKGFYSTASLTLTLNDMRKFSELATYVGGFEELSLYSPHFTSSKEGAERKKAIGGALKAARDKAELLAKAGNATLGQLKSVTETNLDAVSNSTGRSRNLGYSSNAFTAMSIDGIQSVEFSVQVTATFELK